jgi:hypothetical protein
MQIVAADGFVGGKTLVIGVDECLRAFAQALVTRVLDADSRG